MANLVAASNTSDYMHTTERTTTTNSTVSIGRQASMYEQVQSIRRQEHLQTEDSGEPDYGGYITPMQWSKRTQPSETSSSIPNSTMIRNRSATSTYGGCSSSKCESRHVHVVVPRQACRQPPLDDFHPHFPF